MPSAQINGQILGRIQQLKKDRQALLLAHYYQRPEVQDAADHVGDSLELCRWAARASEPVIVLCGVRFMAETAALLCPEKKVLLPRGDAGCALADTVQLDRLRQVKSHYADLAVVAYINTSIDVKAESDLCCTSANAAQVLRSIETGRRILFLPDRNLGTWAARQSGREVILWDGLCPTHAALSREDLLDAKAKFPDARVMVHPECALEIHALADCVAGTSGLLAYAANPSSGNEFIVGTEQGMLHRLRQENPRKRFYPAADHLVCPSMKMTTLEDVEHVLRQDQRTVTVESPIRDRAKAAVEAMLDASRTDHPHRPLVRAGPKVKSAEIAKGGGS